MSSSSHLRLACGTVLAVTPLLDVANLYTTTYTRLIRLYNQSNALGAFPVLTEVLYFDRMQTLRIALREIDENGIESAADLTGLTPYLRLHKRQPYYEVGDAVVTADEELTVESPATDGLCYLTYDNDSVAVPAVGEYIAEVAFRDGDEYATFSHFKILSTRPDI